MKLCFILELLNKIFPSVAKAQLHIAPITSTYRVRTPPSPHYSDTQTAKNPQRSQKYSIQTKACRSVVRASVWRPQAKLDPLGAALPRAALQRFP